MANTYTSLHCHIVFGTKNREPWIGHEIEQRVWEFLGGIARENGLQPLLTGGMPDHIHLLTGFPPTITLSNAVKQIKGGSSRWIKETFAGMDHFAWQDGYGAFAVSKSSIPSVRSYIAKQREHHAARTFREEFIALLDRHGVEYDSRYLPE